MKWMNGFAFVSMFCTQLCLASFDESQTCHLTVHLKNGEHAFLEVDSSESFSDVIFKIESLEQAFLEDNESQVGSYFFSYKPDGCGSFFVEKSNGSTSRNYHAILTAQEKDDISYIVTTLGRSSLKKLLTAKSSLKKAGSRVDHVHPLKFISCIFSHEELKVGILQIKERGGWVAKEFFNGLYDGLKEESHLQNLKTEFIIDFAEQLKIDPNAIISVIEDHDWKRFVNVLIEALPRNGNPNRYDM